MGKGEQQNKNESKIKATTNGMRGARLLMIQFFVDRVFVIRKAIVLFGNQC